MSNQFVYPYNFVPAPELEAGDRAPERKPYKPHDVIDGISGRIEFVLETLTPLFIPDPDKSCEYWFDNSGNKKHRYMRFFQVDGKLCIPGSSIRGMIRSLAEAASGSSITVREGWNAPRTWRKSTQVSGRHPGILSGGAGSWRIQPLQGYRMAATCTRSLLGAYFAITNDDDFAELNGRPVGFSLNAADCFDDLWDIGASSSTSMNCKTCVPPHKGWIRVRRGWRFLDTALRKDSAFRVYAVDGASVRVDDTVVERAKQATPTTNGEREWATEDIPGTGKYVFYTTSNAGEVDELGPCNMYKELEANTAQGFAKYCYSWWQPEEVSACADPLSEEVFCPVTRLFGHVPVDGGGTWALAGRVRFNLARSTAQDSDTKEVALDILSAPKTQYYPFYLRSIHRNHISAGDPWPMARYSDAASWARLRGRKFYLHHQELGNLPQNLWETKFGIRGERNRGDWNPDGAEYLQGEMEGYPRTSQNSTVWPCKCGVQFRASIDFENLEPGELGMLLWCLGAQFGENERAQRHVLKLGMGKPLGLGSVAIRSVTVKTYDGVNSFRTLDPQRQSAGPEDVADWLRGFYDMLGFSEEQFGQLQRTQALLTMLRFDFPAARPSYRARVCRQGAVNRPVKPNEGFGYFVAQKRQPAKRDPADPNVRGEEPLRSPAQIEHGSRQTDDR